MSSPIDLPQACQLPTMIAASQPDLNFFWALLIVVAMFVAILFLLSGVGGWLSLAATYRSTAPRLGKPLRCSAVLGQWPWSVFYRGIVHVRLNSAGITLSLFPVCRLFHPPLFIPWRDVSECKRVPFWFTTCTSIRVRESSMIRMRFLGEAGKAIFETYSQIADSQRSGTQ